jgi:hypothetical protein
VTSGELAEETEHDKVHFFCDELSIPKKSLPAKAYEGVLTPEPTLRYFVDKFPLFLDCFAGSFSPVVTPGPILLRS